MTYEAEKHYADDWAKAKSRDLVRDVIERNLLRIRKPKDLQVLCFPGIDATEVFQVYDSLGIPRENITGLERDPYVAEQIERKNLGIKIVRKSVEDFVDEGESLGFDVVSLDYTSPLTDSNTSTLKAIIRKNKQNEQVVHQANLAKRDGKNEEAYRFGVVHNIDLSLYEIFRSFNPFSPRIIGEKMERNLESIGDMDFKSKREGGYHPLIETIMSGEGEITAIQMLRNIYKFLGIDVEDIQNRLNNMNPLTMCIERAKLLEQGARLVRKKISKITFNDSNLADLITSALLSEGIKEKVIIDGEKYSYISESGAPMIGGVYYMKNLPNMPEARNIAKTVGWPDGIRYTDKGKLHATVRPYVKKGLEFIGLKKMREGIIVSQKPIIFLGSSAKPVLTKARAIEEMRTGLSDDEIARKYRGVNGKPLPQWRAHVTMGTYDTPKSEEIIQEAEEDKDLAKITKEEAIDLLGSGIPTDEIFDAYPTSFTKGQLRAFKAHITMGTYPNGKKEEQ